jgi:hypothetical protein
MVVSKRTFSFVFLVITIKISCAKHSKYCRCSDAKDLPVCHDHPLRENTYKSYKLIAHSDKMWHDRARIIPKLKVLLTQLAITLNLPKTHSYVSRSSQDSKI